MKQPNEFEIPPAPWQEAEKAIEALANQVAAMGAEQYGVPVSVIKAIADIATHVWKAQARMVDQNSGEVRDEMKRVYGDIDRINRCLSDLGIVIEDHTRKPFDYGLPWKVVAAKPMPGITKEIVTETLRPTIRWHEKIIQHAEVEIGTPA